MNSKICFYTYIRKPFIKVNILLSFPSYNIAFKVIKLSLESKDKRIEVKKDIWKKEEYNRIRKEECNRIIIEKYNRIRKEE